MEISEALFRTADGQFRVKKGGRERYVRLLARAIQDPWRDLACVGYHRQGSARSACIVVTSLGSPSKAKSLPCSLPYVAMQ